jgi:CRISPR-associated endonuclease Cas2
MPDSGVSRLRSTLLGSAKQQETKLAKFLLTYDLIAEKDGYDYEPLWAELKRLGGVKTQYSVYLIELNNSQQQVVDHFKTFMDGDDYLMVVELTKKPNFTKAMNGTNAWIAANFS